MKQFNSIQELWSYCLFCQICQDITRNIQVLVGPDDSFVLHKFVKENNNLILNCSFHFKKQKYKINYIINCINNTFIVDISELEESDHNINGASSPYFYFYILSDCISCNNSQVNSNDLELNLVNKTISNIGLEREGIYLMSEKDKYSISYEYDVNKMLISKCLLKENDTIFYSKPLHCNIIDFDFSDITKTLQRIKTIFVFS